MSIEKSAVIVGAGLVGSLWAVFLAKRGYRVDVFERREDMRVAGFAGGRSINLALSRRGWKALEIAGVKQAILAGAIPMYGRMMHDPEGELTFQPYGKEGQAIYSVSRGGLNVELMNIADSFPNVRFYFNEKCLDVDLDEGKLLLENTATGKNSEVIAPIIFGADGAFSAVRGSMQRLPRFNYSQTYLDYGYKELTIPPAESGAHLMENNALHIWPRGKFMLIALPNIDGTFTCTLFLPFEGRESFENLTTDDQVRAFFNSFFPDAVPLIPRLLEDFRQNPTSTLTTIRCSPWHYKDRALLIGDAAHAIVPFYGQGMNSGFEDCTILDELMEKHNHHWPAIIEEFNRTRSRDADAIADLALRNFVEMRDQVADPLFLLRKKMEVHFMEKYPEEFLPVYSMVTFSHIPYHKALLESQAQDELFRRIFAIDGVADNWEENPAVEAAFKEWLRDKVMG
jgi:kynurenine 3-monooxygenase